MAEESTQSINSQTLQKNDQWKNIGIYASDQSWSINKDFIVYVFTKEQKGVYYYQGNIIEVSYDTTQQGISYNQKFYERYYSLVSKTPNSWEEIGNSQKNLTGKIRKNVRIGNILVFKTSSQESLESCIEETSRNLIAISKGLPHAFVFGILAYENNYYEVEEKLDIPRARSSFCQAKRIYERLVTKAPLNENDVNVLLQYCNLFINLKEQLEQNNIGGDFKLDNLGFRMESNTLVGTDIILGQQQNQFLPLPWNEWLEIARKEEGSIDLFLDPFQRLNSFSCINGGRRIQKRARFTRKYSTKLKTKKQKKI